MKRSLRSSQSKSPLRERPSKRLNPDGNSSLNEDNVPDLPEVNTEQVVHPTDVDINGSSDLQNDRMANNSINVSKINVNTSTSAQNGSGGSLTNAGGSLTDIIIADPEENSENEQGQTPRSPIRAANAVLAKRCEEIKAKNEKLAADIRKRRAEAEHEQLLAEIESGNRRTAELEVEVAAMNGQSDPNTGSGPNVNESHSETQVTPQPPAANKTRSPNAEEAQTTDPFVKLAKAITDLKSEPKPIVFKRAPPKFDGTSDLALSWFKDYESAAVTNKWTDTEKAQHLSGAFKNNGKIWFDGHFYVRDVTWDGFVKEFFNVYRPPGSALQRKCQFYDLKHMTDENPIDYLNRLIYMRNEVEPKPSDEEVVEVAKRRLRPFYAAAIIRDVTISEVRNTLGRLVQIHEYNESQTKPKTSDNSEERKLKLDGLFRPRTPGMLIDPREKPKKMCFNCSKAGHILKNCTEPKDQERINKNYMNLLNARNPTTQSDGNALKTKLPQSQSYDQVEEVKQLVQAEVSRIFESRQASSIISNAIKQIASKPSNSCPHVPVLINEKRVMALIDTGGSLTLMSSELAEYLKVNTKPANMELSGVEPLVKLSGIVDKVDITYNGKTVEMPIKVLPNLKPHLVLGIDFISALGLIIDVSRKSISVRSDINGEKDGPQSNGNIKVRCATNRENALLSANTLEVIDVYRPDVSLLSQQPVMTYKTTESQQISNIEEEIKLIKEKLEMANKAEEVVEPKGELVNVQKENKAEFSPGDKVMVHKKQLIRDRNGEWTTVYSGPFKIIEKVGPLAYRITSRRGSNRCIVVSESILKKFCPTEINEEFPTVCADSSDSEGFDKRTTNKSEQQMKRTKRPTLLDGYVYHPGNFVNQIGELVKW